MSDSKPRMGLLLTHRRHDHAMPIGIDLWEDGRHLGGRIYSGDAAVSLAADIIALACIVDTSLDRTRTGTKLEGYLRDIAIGARAVHWTVNEPPEPKPGPDEHAPVSVDLYPDGSHRGNCRCGYTTPPRGRHLTALSTLCAHVLDPEGNTP